MKSIQWIGSSLLLMVCTVAQAEYVQFKEPTINNNNIAEQALNKTESRDSFASNAQDPKENSASIIERLNTVAAASVRNFSQTGIASWYGRQFHGKKTANGEVFNMHELTAAHKSLPLNCMIRVTNTANGKSVVVRVNDRGPFHGNRIVDLSYGAAQAIGITDMGVARVNIQRIDKN